jgi:hypothetical protein
MSLSDLDLEALLRDQRLRAADVAPPPADLAQQVRGRYRRQTRQRIALAAAALAVAAVFVAVSTVGSALLGGTGDPAAPPAPSAAGATALYGVPTRGSLADDAAWVDAVAALDWGSPGPDADPRLQKVAPAGHRVVFAGDVHGARTALVLGMAGRTTFAVWFLGPEGATPDELVPAGAPRMIHDGQPQALWDAPAYASGGSTLVVVGLPGERLEFMAGHEASAQGEVHEAWRGLSAADGVAVAIVDPPTSGQSIMLVRADGEAPVPAVLSGRSQAVPATLVEPSDPRGLRPHTPDGALQFAIGDLAAYFAVDPERLKPELLWQGRLGGASPDSGVLVGVTLPSGATTVMLVEYQPFTDPNGRGFTVSFAPMATPASAGAGLLDRVWAVVGQQTITVSGPLSGATAELLDGGRVIGRFPLAAGAGSGDAPSATWRGDVRVRDAAGRVVGEAPVSDPLG